VFQDEKFQGKRKSDRKGIEGNVRKNSVSHCRGKKAKKKEEERIALTSAAKVLRHTKEKTTSPP